MDTFKAFERHQPEGYLPFSPLVKRQQPILALPTTYEGINDGPKPGIIVAIILGSIAGFLLVFWLFLLCLRFGGRPFGLFSGDRTVVEEEIVHRTRPARHRSRSPRTEAIYVQEQRSRRRTTQLRTHETTRGDVEGEVSVIAGAALRILLTTE